MVARGNRTDALTFRLELELRRGERKIRRRQWQWWRHWEALQRFAVSILSDIIENVAK